MADETDAVEEQVEDGQRASDFALEIDGRRVDGILALRGLVAFRLDVRTTTAIRKLQEPFKVVRKLQHDPQDPCNVWVSESYGAGEDIVRPARTLALLALDEGEVLRRWTVRDAWIAEVGYSDFDSKSGDLLEETLTIHYKDIEPDPPASREKVLPADQA